MTTKRAPRRPLGRCPDGQIHARGMLQLQHISVLSATCCAPALWPAEARHRVPWVSGGRPSCPPRCPARYDRRSRRPGVSCRLRPRRDPAGGFRRDRGSTDRDPQRSGPEQQRPVRAHRTMVLQRVEVKPGRSWPSITTWNPDRPRRGWHADLHLRRGSAVVRKGEYRAVDPRTVRTIKAGQTAPIRPANGSSSSLPTSTNRHRGSARSSSTSPRC